MFAKPTLFRNRQVQIEHGLFPRRARRGETFLKPLMRCRICKRFTRPCGKTKDRPLKSGLLFAP